MRRYVLALMGFLAVGCDSTAEPLPVHPNLIVILVDDVDMASMQHLPRLRRLGEEGVVFSNAFVSYSACAPSRASLLRGQYAHNHAVIANSGPRGGFAHWYELNRESSTIATWLQSAGYRTAFFGKYLNLYPDGASEDYVPPGWDEWYGSLKTHYYDFRLNENGQPVYYPCCEEYETDVLTSRATDFARRSAASGEPFFLLFSPFAAHDPADPAPRHAAEFAGVKAPRTPSFNEADVSDKPPHIRDLPLLSDERIAEIDELFRQRLRTLLAVEDMLDSLYATLESAGTLERTYILFFSDNGFHFGQHRMGASKLTAYDEDIRVPFYVRGPGIRPGRVEEALVLSHDLAPTLAELGGAIPTNDVDGRSLVPLLVESSGGGAARRRGFAVERWRSLPDEPDLLMAYRALRTREHLYVEWENGQFELYNRNHDPYELENIYREADGSLLARLRSWLESVSGCSGPGCRSAEDGLGG